MPDSAYASHDPNAINNIRSRLYSTYGSNSTAGFDNRIQGVPYNDIYINPYVDRYSNVRIDPELLRQASQEAAERRLIEKEALQDPMIDPIDVLMPIGMIGGKFIKAGLKGLGGIALEELKMQPLEVAAENAIYGLGSIAQKGINGLASLFSSNDKPKAKTRNKQEEPFYQQAGYGNPNARYGLAQF